MSFLNKVYTYERHERFDEWLKSIGIPHDKVAAYVSTKSTQKIVKNGDSYVITQSTSKGPKNTTFKSGVEFDDTIGDDNHPIQNIFTVDGNTITQNIKSGLGSATFTREFDGDNLVVTITSDKFDGAAKRFYKA